VDRKTTTDTKGNKKPPNAAGGTAGSASDKTMRKNGGWQQVEALREKAALKVSLADVWDEEFDLDDEILAELDHKAEFFTSQEDAEEEIFDDDEDVGEFFDDDEV